MSNTKPEKCPRCTSQHIFPIPSWKGKGYVCGTCGHVIGETYKLKDTARDSGYGGEY